MNVRTRMLIGLTTLPVLLLILIGSGWTQISHLNSANKVIKSNFDSTILVSQIRVDIKDEGILLRNLLLQEKEEDILETLAEIQVEQRTVQQSILLLQESATTSKQKEIVNSLKEANDEFDNYVNQILAYLANDNKQQAILLMNNNSEKFHNKISLITRNINQSFDEDLSNSLEGSIKNLQSEIIITGLILAIGILVILTLLSKLVFSTTRRMSSMADLMSNISNGQLDLGTKVQIIGNDEFDEMGKSFNQLTDTLQDQMRKEKELTWKKTNIADISTSLTGKDDLKSLGGVLLSKIIPLVEANNAVFYVKDIDGKSANYKLISTFAVNGNIKKTIKPGEGLIGQTIIEKKPLILSEIPNDYLHISSGLGGGTPKNVFILPILYEGVCVAILELASLKAFNKTNESFLNELAYNLGILLESVIGRIQLANLLEESQTLMEEIQAQSEELQNQQEELKATNEELEEQTQNLRQSEIKLQMQQEELEQTNVELEEKAKRLEEQNAKYEEANRIVEQARKELEIKAEQLALSSKYKSEFLANMSHELRTPLNSLIILSKLLADNQTDNLSEKQVEYAKTIYSSGNDLLNLINSILDLAKIESGKTEIIPGDVQIVDLVEFVENNFAAVADNQQLNFQVEVQENIQPTIYSDQLRIQQVLQNLLANAFKFTHNGDVWLKITEDANRTEQYGKPIIAFSVVDSGIGISTDKLNIIFEAFQQADGTTSRKYGGTGLGLSISREIAALLGGELVVESEEGKGSKFTLYVGDYELKQIEESMPSSNVEVAATLVEDRVILLSEITNAEGTLPSPTTQTSRIKRLLIVDDHLNQRNSLMELIGNMDFIITAVSSGREAIETLRVESIDCMILDLGLLDTNGFDLLAQIKNNPANQHIKIFIYTGRDISYKEEMELNKFAQTIIIKNEHSPERLVAELEDYLVESSSTTKNNNIVMQLVTSKHSLTGKKILLVDDDVRNVFALSSVLETAGMKVVFAENGIESLKILEQHPDVDLILMDIMMPEMDGYEAIIKIRENPLHEQLPVIALTAKAMKEDREKCLQIGASDYIAKPVEPDQLISLIKVWLY
ncbi:response regulator [Lysinibacillus yapensis]|uniref:Circadian input-output histidine kinase CikA n=1 Tax=Ureibacillus yapensis TaxID=2304605 RepID=A0A396S951_9BACL|nr:response regulator [Lysinibacillus yapensis]RHW37434.1 response regulator [Lysinibacillus yapensis]